ncbi:hypothetical protein APSETT445_007231 [Aspergillus pseudonomiae]
MIQFHSTLAYLADPPQSYQQPAVDLMAGLSQLQRDINDNIFHNEYAFETALSHLIHAAHDDHLKLVGGALSRFTYAAPYSIVSVSLDGVELPKVYISGGYPESYDESPEADLTTISNRAAPILPSFENPAYPSKADVIEESYTRDGGTLLRGYFLHDSSLAVLSIPHFDSNTPQSFSNAVKEFLARSTNAGLKKVVIDVQQNPGGSPLLALEVFKTFFPSITPWASSRRRVHPMANALGSTLTTYWQNLTMGHPEYYTLIPNEWVVTGRLDSETGRNFTSWDDFVGPTDHYCGDGFTKKASNPLPVL